ncbi:hypothetical protein [uncultured Polaribacter sp.]|uniref:hypothetical protein n=1 Tax=uncultured Polaribacter sp. TaxID=174711 RepID=UPI0026264287|nr:hypothetical protein [uncultured Polaribacter sp.]
MAFPKRNQKDYTALKKGIVRNIIDKKNSRKKSKEFHKKINSEIYITDSLLKIYIEECFCKDVRAKAYQLFIRAKNNKKAVVSYFNFINAHKLSKKDVSYGNIAAMSFDLAEKLLKKKYKKKRHSKNKPQKI